MQTEDKFRYRISRVGNKVLGLGDEQNNLFGHSLYEQSTDPETLRDPGAEGTETGNYSGWGHSATGTEPDFIGELLDREGGECNIEAPWGDF